MRAIEALQPSNQFQGMVGVLARDRPAMLNMIGKAFNGIFDNPTDIFLRVKVMDILFRGTNINCDRTEFAPKAVCTALKKEAVSGLVMEPNNQFKFSIFGTVSIGHTYNIKFTLLTNVICKMLQLLKDLILYIKLKFTIKLGFH